MLASLSSSKEESHSLVHLGVGPGRLREAKHPTHDPAAVETPAQVTNLPPPPSMLHFHHTLGHQVLPLGGHEDGPEADLFDLHLALTLEGSWQTTISCQLEVEEEQEGRRRSERESGLSTTQRVGGSNPAPS